MKRVISLSTKFLFFCLSFVLLFILFGVHPAYAVVCCSSDSTCETEYKTCFDAGTCSVSCNYSSYYKDTCSYTDGNVCYVTYSEDLCILAGGTWGDWGSCGDPEPVLCYQTKFCIGFVTIKQIRQCTCGATPTSEPSGNDPKGAHDGSNCTNSGGWTCDADSYSTALTVKFYSDTGRTNYLGETTANVAREQGVADNCGGYPNHGFGFLTPESLKDNTEHCIYAYAINIGSGSDRLLPLSSTNVRCFTCAAPPPSTGRVQGCKILGTDGNCYNPANSAFDSKMVKLDGVTETQLGNSAQNSYAFTNISAGPHTVALPVGPEGYVLDGYTKCGDGLTGCHTLPLTGSSSSVVVNVPSGSFIDLWWHFTQLPPPPPAWWQVKDADVTTNGNLGKVSSIPSGKKFDLDGAGGFPGVPMYAGGATGLTNLNVSTKGWRANTQYKAPNGRIYNYDFFSSLIPHEITPKDIPTTSVSVNFFATDTGVTPSGGYYWYKYSGVAYGGLLTIASQDLRSSGRKVILLVDSADLKINGNIIYTPGQGFFMVIAKGNINIDPTVKDGTSSSPNLMGFYLADLDFSTGHKTTGDDSPLYIKGSVSAYGEINLERNLGSLNLSTPGETFEFSPSDIFTYPPQLSIERTRWKEIAP